MICKLSGAERQAEQLQGIRNKIWKKSKKVVKNAWHDISACDRIAKLSGESRKHEQAIDQTEKISEKNRKKFEKMLDTEIAPMI